MLLNYGWLIRQSWWLASGPVSWAQLSKTILSLPELDLSRFPHISFLGPLPSLPCSSEAHRAVIYSWHPVHRPREAGLTLQTRRGASLTQRNCTCPGPHPKPLLVPKASRLCPEAHPCVNEFTPASFPSPIFCSDLEIYIFLQQPSANCTTQQMHKQGASLAPHPVPSL